MREPQSALVLVILFFVLFLGDFLHRPHARNIRARGGPKRPHVRFGDLGPGNVEIAESLAVDLDRDLPGSLSNLYLGSGRQSEESRR